MTAKKLDLLGTGPNRGTPETVQAATRMGTFIIISRCHWPQVECRLPRGHGSRSPRVARSVTQLP
jgi:hypothetical protein